MPLALLANPKNAAILALSLALMATTGLCYVRGLKLDTAQHRAETATRDALALKSGLVECAAINGRNSLHLQQQAQAMATLKADSARQEQEAAERVEKARRTAQEARQRDTERRARADMPTPAEMTQALREAVEGL